MKLNPFAMMQESPDGTAIVLDPDSNTALSLNQTALVAWKVFAKGGDIPEAVSAILESFQGVTEAQLRTDLEGFVEKLREKNLLEEK